MLLVLEKLLEADPEGRVDCFGLTDGANPVDPATICGCVSTTVLGGTVSWRTLHIFSSNTVTLCECGHILQMFFHAIGICGLDL